MSGRHVLFRAPGGHSAARGSLAARGSTPQLRLRLAASSSFHARLDSSLGLAGCATALAISACSVRSPARRNERAAAGFGGAPELQQTRAEGAPSLHRRWPRPRRLTSRRGARVARLVLGKQQLEAVESEFTKLRSQTTGTLWATALLSGPLSAAAYPALRKLSAALQQNDTSLCWAVLGLCGGVPPALQEYFKSIVSLLFSFLLGYTFYALLARQQTLYNALFEETAVLTQLIEEAQLFLPRDAVLKVAKCVRQYISPAWSDPREQDPAQLSASVLRSDRDAVEEMSRILIKDGKVDPAYGEVLISVRALRVARARRLAAMQSTIPGVQFGILSVLALLVALPPFLDPSSDSSTLSQLLYGLLVSVLVLVLAVVQDVANPNSKGVYSTEREREIILSALRDALLSMEEEAQESSQE